MEEWEANHISLNISQLMRVTNCNIELLAKMNQLFSEDELDIVLSKSTPQEKANTLYRTAKQKVDGYRKLAVALQASKQTGALKIILNGYELNNKPIPAELKPGTGPGQSTMPRKFEDKVMGDNDCTKSQVVEAIVGSTSFSSFGAKWKSVARRLNIEDSDINRLSDEYILGVKVITLEDVLDQLLTLWIRQGRQATKIVNLRDALKGCGLTAIAETLESKLA